MSTPFQMRARQDTGNPFLSTARLVLRAYMKLLCLEKPVITA